jgi:hypothetical protein
MGKEYSEGGGMGEQAKCGETCHGRVDAVLGDVVFLRHL